jgi:hypothetical protein
MPELQKPLLEPPTADGYEWRQPGALLAGNPRGARYTLLRASWCDYGPSGRAAAEPSGEDKIVPTAVVMERTVDTCQPPCPSCAAPAAYPTTPGSFYCQPCGSDCGWEAAKDAQYQREQATPASDG